MIRVTAHAIDRLFERGAHTALLDEILASAESIHDAIASRLRRACVAAHKLGLTEYHIRLDGLRFIIREGAVVTVVTNREDHWARKNGIARPDEAFTR